MQSSICDLLAANAAERRNRHPYGGDIRIIGSVDGPSAVVTPDQGETVFRMTTESAESLVQIDSAIKVIESFYFWMESNPEYEDNEFIDELCCAKEGGVDVLDENSRFIRRYFSIIDDREDTYTLFKNLVSNIRSLYKNIFEFNEV